MEQPKPHSFYDLCRLCLENQGLTNICSKEGLTQDVYLCTGVVVSSRDNLPQKICIKCVEVIVNAKRLRDKAMATDRHLKCLFVDDDPLSLGFSQSDKDPAERNSNSRRSSTDSDRTVKLEIDEIQYCAREEEEGEEHEQDEVEKVEQNENEDEVENKEQNGDEVEHEEKTDDKVENEEEEIIPKKRKARRSDSLVTSENGKPKKKITVRKDLFNSPRTSIRANISIEAKENIVALYSDGLNISQISNETGLCRETIRRWVKRYKEEGSLKSRERSGRPALISQPQRRYMVGEYETNGFIPRRRFAVEFGASVRTVCRTLHAEGIHRPPPAKKKFLTQKQKEERLRFAREYLDFDWETTIFTKNVSFRLRQKGKYTASGTIIVNIWGWISAQGPGELTFISTRTNSSNYVEILNDVMLPTVRNVYPAQDVSVISFVQDCPIQRSRVVREWFNNHPEIKLIPWPARSPDLNPIEKIWDLMVQRWKYRVDICPELLKSHCMQVWDSLRGTDVCTNIVSSMRQRLISCIEANGGHIKY